MNPVKFPLQAALLLACAVATAPAVAEQREHGVHVHGHGQLNVVLDGNTLLIELETPAANLLGFEHAPRDGAEQAALKQAISRLRNATALFTLPAAAGCKLEEATIDSALLDHETDEHGDDVIERPQHSDIEASYRFLCAHPGELDGMTLNLFRQFPATEELEAQVLTPRGQTAMELTVDSPRLAF